jgi:antibiotic biosynthesis monooxygenase (ABM) superfamily enzyme
MNDVPVLYMVRSWTKPEGGRRYLDWLEDKHMAEVVDQPGVLWARKVALDQPDEQGWPCLLLIYGFASREDLQNYLESPARDGFWNELESFKDVHYSERFYGDVDFAVDA